MITGLDEYPIHQLPQPLMLPGSSDRNFYDRSYFNGFDRSGAVFFISGIGYYPNLGTKDAYFMVHRVGADGDIAGGTNTAVHLGEAIDHDRMNQRVGGFSLEILEPLQKLRLVIDDVEGISADLTWNGLFPVAQEEHHLMLSAKVRPIIDAQRFAQVGSWTGALAIDGDEYDVRPDEWMGSRDRSWGIRPVGESEPPGKPADPPFDGMWWLYCPVAFDEFFMVFIVQEEPDGFRTLNDVTRIWRDGRVEQMGWPRIAIDYRSGTRLPTGGVITCATPEGAEVRVDIEAVMNTATHIGAGYGGDSGWTHGVWRGEGFVERITHDLADPEVAGRLPFGLIDSTGRFTWHEGGSARTGWGLFEHGVLGQHRPSGFTDWFVHAP
ncbi:hypothetical protein [Nocardioides acrostichi]|uniref:Uncharacterized protein n=1 Tax=Nocardioides acrostichi TaxID=2784339 RepID=A0A930UW66_9ACTN|nr:hypothetical protein [Nocardioides acrostichi]MBF4160180.1 hypothetical protein [Nocardioides acrostichi]